MPDDFLLTEFEQQYNQYRHLDQLRSRYIEYFTAVTAAVLTGSLVYGASDPLKLASLWPLYILLFFIGVLITLVSVGIRMRQMTTAWYLMAIRDHISSTKNLRIIANVELCFATKGFTLYESAIVLIFFLILLDSALLTGAILAILYPLGKSLSILAHFNDSVFNFRIYFGGALLILSVFHGQK